MLFGLGNTDSPNFHRFIFHLLVRFFHILLLWQTLKKEVSFLQIYLNTKFLFLGSYQGSLINENLLGQLPWLYLGWVFLHTQKYLLEFLLMRIPWCQMLFCFSKIIYFTFTLDEYICLIYEYVVLQKQLFPLRVF